MYRRLPHDAVHLHIDLDRFPFFARERDAKGHVVTNRCGRDFLAFSMAHLRPGVYARYTGLPAFSKEIGWPVHSSLVWTGLPFWKLPRYLATHNLELRINGARCNTTENLLRCLWFPPKLPYGKAMQMAHQGLRMNRVVGIDVSLGWAGLFNHVMFVWAMDNEEFAVFDTHVTPGLEYAHFDVDQQDGPTREDRFIMRLPFDIVEKRWKRWSRVWEISTRK
jgi:hypothetical protein